MVLKGPKGNEDSRDNGKHRKQDQDECFRFAFIHAHPSVLPRRLAW